jgi:hypothetical protein
MALRSSPIMPYIQIGLSIRPSVGHTDELKVASSGLQLMEQSIEYRKKFLRYPQKWRTTILFNTTAFYDHLSWQKLLPD